MDESLFAMLLLAIGLGLLVAEIFIPSGGMILIAALLSLSGSVWFAWRAWWEASRLAWWTYIGTLIVLLPVAVGGALYLFPRTAMGKRILLEGPDPEEVAPYSKQENQAAQWIGKRGKTLTLLNPGGLVLVEGERLHCESEGILIDPGREVKVVATKGNRVVVRLAPAESQPSRESPSREEPSRDDRSSSDAPLDFDIP